MPRHLRSVSVVTALVLLGSALTGCSSDDTPAAKPSVSDSSGPADSGSSGAADPAVSEALASYAEELVATWVGAAKGTAFDALGGVRTMDRGARMVVRSQTLASGDVKKMQACAHLGDTAFERRFVFRLTDKPDYVESADRKVAHC